MKVLGFYLGRHDSNVAIYDSATGFVKYIKSERHVGVKHHRATLKFVKKFIERNYFKPDVIVYTDGNRNGLGACSTNSLWEHQADNARTKKINSALQTNVDKIYNVDHHFAHVLSCWPVVPTKEVEFGVSIDGKGDHKNTIIVVKNPEDVIKKKAMTNVLMHSGDLKPGRLLMNIGKLMGLKGNPIDFAGKIMGAYAYGNIDKKYLDGKLAKFQENKDFGTIDNSIIRKNTPRNMENQSFIDALATQHHLIGELVFRIFTEFVDKDAVISYSGGVAQNTVWNEELISNFRNMHIIPHAYDGGLSLGCLEFARIMYDLNQMHFDNFPYVQDDEELSVPSEATMDEVADLLASGKIVAWFQGSGEIGPRALGNRSLLMHPGIAAGKDILNRRVKHREWWRPFAPSVLQEYAHEWFDIEGSSPYMLRAVKVRKDKIDLIKSVVHKDSSSRIQTVSSKDNWLYHKLITKFYERTGIPLLLNTSLNDGGMPIFSSKDQCKDYYQKVDIDALCAGSKLYTKTGVDIELITHPEDKGE